MKTVNVSFRSIALSFAILAANAFASYNLITVGSHWGSGPTAYGTIYSVPAGADYEWEVTGDATIAASGGGLNVPYVGGSGSGLGTTSYADNITYDLYTWNISGEGGYAVLYVGW